MRKLFKSWEDLVHLILFNAKKFFLVHSIENTGTILFVEMLYHRQQVTIIWQETF